MQFQFDISPNVNTPMPAHSPPAQETVYLLRQMLDLQRDLFSQLLDLQKQQLEQTRATAQDGLSRWRQILTRWAEEYPGFAEHCKKAYPLMEKSYIQMLASLVEELAQQGDDALDSEFAVQEFLDRYGMKIGQLSHLLSIIGPLSEAAHQNEAAAKQQEQTPPPA
jgi:hypothetical protein